MGQTIEKLYGRKPKAEDADGDFKIQVARDIQMSVGVPSSSVCDVGGGGAVGLYSGFGFAGVLNCLIPVFFGFFFSRPRLSRLPMTCSLLLS